MKTISIAILLVAAACATPAAAPDSAATAVNQRCPMMEEAIDPAVAVDFEGRRVAFCCDDCVEEWQELSEDGKRAALAKVAVTAPPARQRATGHGTHRH